MGERGLVVEQGLIPGGYGGINARLQVSQVAPRTDDPPADLLEDPGTVRIAGRLGLDKTRLEALVRQTPVTQKDYPLASATLAPLALPPQCRHAGKSLDCQDRSPDTS